MARSRRIRKEEVNPMPTMTNITTRSQDFSLEWSSTGS